MQEKTIESLQNEIDGLRVEIDYHQKVNTLCTRLDTLEGRVKVIETDISEIKTNQKQLQLSINDILVTITGFIHKHKFDLIKWSAFGTISLMITFTGLYLTQRQSLEGVKDDIIKVLIEEKLKNSQKVEERKSVYRINVK